MPHCVILSPRSISYIRYCFSILGYQALIPHSSIPSTSFLFLNLQHMLLNLGPVGQGARAPLWVLSPSTSSTVALPCEAVAKEQDEEARGSGCDAREQVDESGTRGVHGQPAHLVGQRLSDGIA